MKLLAPEPERRVHQDRLCELWWPGHTGVPTRNNLHQSCTLKRRYDPTYVFRLKQNVAP